MRLRVLTFLTGMGLVAFAASPAFAEEPPAAEVARTAPAKVVSFDDAGARFDVEHDATAGTMTFRLADDSKVRISEPPVVTLRTDAGPKDVTLTAGDPGTWTLTHESLRTDRVDGTMKILVDGRSYTTALAATSAIPPPTPVPAEALPPPVEARPAHLEEPGLSARHGGRVVSFQDCGGSVEVVQDAASGTLTVYSLMGPEARIDQAPIVVLAEPSGPRTVSLTRIEGDDLAWKTTTLKTAALANAKIRLTMGGKTCEASLGATSAQGMGATAPAGSPCGGPRAAPHTAAMKSRGGQVVVFDGGPRFEVVRDPATGSYTFYQLDETIQGRPVVIEEPPTVLVGDRTYTLTRVENEPRAWRLAGLDAGVTPPGDARMRVSLFGRSLESRVGLGGLGVSAR